MKAEFCFGGSFRTFPPLNHGSQEGDVEMDVDQCSNISNFGSNLSKLTSWQISGTLTAPNDLETAHRHGFGDGEAFEAETVENTSNLTSHASAFSRKRFSSEIKTIAEQSGVSFSQSECNFSKNAKKACLNSKLWSFLANFCQERILFSA